MYSAPPSDPSAIVLDHYDPSQPREISFGKGSKVGRGGMESKIKAAEWAHNNGVAVVIADGTSLTAISDIAAGRRVGTFFTTESNTQSYEEQAKSARRSGRKLQVCLSDTLILIVYLIESGTG